MSIDIWWPLQIGAPTFRRPNEVRRECAMFCIYRSILEGDYLLPTVDWCVNLSHSKNCENPKSKLQFATPRRRNTHPLLWSSQWQSNRDPSIVLCLLSIEVDLSTKPKLNASLNFLSGNFGALHICTAYLRHMWRTCEWQLNNAISTFKRVRCECKTAAGITITNNE